MSANKFTPELQAELKRLTDDVGLGDTTENTLWYLIDFWKVQVMEVAKSEPYSDELMEDAIKSVGSDWWGLA